MQNDNTINLTSQEFVIGKHFVSINFKNNRADEVTIFDTDSEVIFSDSADKAMKLLGILEQVVGSRLLDGAGVCDECGQIAISCKCGEGV